MKGAILLVALLVAGPAGAAAAVSPAGTGTPSDSSGTAADSTQTKATGVAPAEATIGTPDSVFQAAETTPFVYSSTYDRDRASATWTQSASYGIRRDRLAIDLSGNSATVDDILRAGFGGRGGEFSGQLNYRLLPRWIFTTTGHFIANTSGDPATGTRQHQNRVELRTQYSTGQWKGLSLRALLSTEFQQDHNLSYRPLADTIAFSQRDSTTVKGRQDGLSTQLDWKGFSGFTASFQGSGSRVTPVTRTVLTDFRRGSAGGGQTDSVPAPIEAPITNSNLLAKVGFGGIRKVNIGLQLKRVENDQEFFDRVLRGQEHTAGNQRSGTMHVESQPAPALFLSVDGTLARSSNEYRLRRTGTSLVRTQNLATMASYTRPRTRGSLRLEVTRARNERQISQNGVSISRLLTATAAHRLTSRLALDGNGTASLTSYQYDYPAGTTPFANDRDQVRTQLNVGGGYTVSSQCSTTVHFSTGRTHTVAIGEQAAGDNSVQTNYQMAATLLLRPNRNLTVQQNYLLSAIYQIYDYVETRNFLSRIKRIDTSVADTLFPFVYANVVHNFLFRDVGPFVRPSPGESRLYNVSVETYQQNLNVTLGLQSHAGVSAFVSQNLGNTRDRSVAANTEKVTNRWTLTFGGDMTRALSGGAQLQVSARHIGAFTEPPVECEGPNPPASCTGFDRQEEAYWLVNASVQKAF